MKLSHFRQSPSIPVRQTVLTGKVDSNGMAAFLQIRDSDTTIIPAMTGDTSPLGTASASAVFDTYYAYKAFNGLIDEFPWAAPAGTQWLSYEFPESRVVNKYVITGRINASYVNENPKNWTFEGWNGSSWVVLDTQTNQTSWTVSQKRTFTFDNSTAYKKYRINVTANNGGTYLSITELAMMEPNLAIPDSGTVGIDASTPINIAFAAGFDSSGQVDYVETIDEDIADAWTGLTANATNYLYVERNPVTRALTYGTTSVVPTYSVLTPLGIRTQAGTPISSGDQSGYVKANVFDGNASTFWQSLQQGAAVNGTAYIGLDLGTVQSVKGITFKQNGGSNSVTSGLIQTSSNGSTWVTQATQTLNTDTTEGTYTFTVTSARYIRVLANSAPVGGNFFWAVQEMTVLLASELQNWFDLSTFKMKYGPSLTETQRVFVGECAVNSSGQVTSVITYALQGRYDSGWFAVAANTNYTKTHNIGVAIPDGLDPKIYFSLTGDNSDATLAHGQDGTNGYLLGGKTDPGAQNTRNQMTFGTHSTVQWYRNAARTSGYFRLRITRDW